jgi:hypothetical protein
MKIGISNMEVISLIQMICRIECKHKFFIYNISTKYALFRIIKIIDLSI